MYRAHFESFDLNGDGVISSRELKKVSHRLGYRLTDLQIDVSSKSFLSSLIVIALTAIALTVIADVISVISVIIIFIVIKAALHLSLLVQSVTSLTYSTQARTGIPHILNACVYLYFVTYKRICLPWPPLHRHQHARWPDDVTELLLSILLLNTDSDVTPLSLATPGISALWKFN